MGLAIVGIETAIPYGEGSVNSADVAFKLEKRYKVGAVFCDFIAKDLEQKFSDVLDREIRRGELDFKGAFDKALFITSEWLTAQWRDFIKLAKHGMTTKASQERGDPAFVDTGNYFLNMRVRLVQE